MTTKNFNNFLELYFDTIPTKGQRDFLKWIWYKRFAPKKCWTKFKGTAEELWNIFEAFEQVKQEPLKQLDKETFEFLNSYNPFLETRGERMKIWKDSIKNAIANLWKSYLSAFENLIVCSRWVFVVGKRDNDEVLFVDESLKHNDFFWIPKRTLEYMNKNKLYNFRIWKDYIKLEDETKFRKERLIWLTQSNVDTAFARATANNKLLYLNKK